MVTFTSQTFSVPQHQSLSVCCILKTIGTVEWKGSGLQDYMHTSTHTIAQLHYATIELKSLKWIISLVPRPPTVDFTSLQMSMSVKYVHEA